MPRLLPARPPGLGGRGRRQYSASALALGLVLAVLAVPGLGLAVETLEQVQEHVRHRLVEDGVVELVQAAVEPAVEAGVEGRRPPHAVLSGAVAAVPVAPLVAPPPRGGRPRGRGPGAAPGGGRGPRPKPPPPPPPRAR